MLWQKKKKGRQKKNQNTNNHKSVPSGFSASQQKSLAVGSLEKG